MQPLRLAIIVKDFVTTGGMEKFVVEVTSRLRARGHRIDLYAWRVDSAAAKGMNFIPVPRRYRFSSILSLLAFGRDAQRLRLDRTYDIVHAHDRSLGNDILTVHSFPHLTGLQKYPPLRRLDQKYLSLRNQLYLRLEKKQMLTPCLVTVSAPVRDEIVRLYRPKGRLEVIAPGVDTEWFNPEQISRLRAASRRELGLADDNLTVLFVGSEFKRKGLDRLIPALPATARLVVVGRGEQLPHYQALAARYGLTDRLIFTGLVNDVRRYYAAADVVALPSTSEAFGMTILEAMACGLPPVVTSNTGVADLIRDNDNGLRLDSPAQLGPALEKLRDAKLRERLGRAARRTAEQYTWERTALAYEALYYEIVADRVAKAATTDGPPSPISPCRPDRCLFTEPLEVTAKKIIEFDREPLFC